MQARKGKGRKFKWQYVLLLPLVDHDMAVLFCSGLCPAEAEFRFLQHARRLDLYGVELFDAKVTALFIRLKVANSLVLLFSNFFRFYRRLSTRSLFDFKLFL